MFGLSWIRVGATIKRIPLLNNLVISGIRSLAVIVVLDCTYHMVDIGNKDAAFIKFFFRSKVDEFDPGKSLTDTLSFMRQQIFRKQGKSYVHTFCGKSVSMEENMFCNCFFVTCQELVQQRYACNLFSHLSN